jgi:hypothetical protein
MYLHNFMRNFMKHLIVFMYAVTFFLSATNFADVIINVGKEQEKEGEEKEEEKKEQDEEESKKEGKEEKEPVRPEPSVLKINAANETDKNLGIHIHAGVKDSNNEEIIITNISLGQSPLTTLATLITPEPNTEFKFVESIAYYGDENPNKFKCRVEPKSEEKENHNEEKSETPKEDEELKKTEEAPKEDKDTKEDTDQNDEDEENEQVEKSDEFPVKKSINVRFYIPKSQFSPHCVITFDD